MKLSEFAALLLGWILGTLIVIGLTMIRTKLCPGQELIWTPPEPSLREKHKQLMFRVFIETESILLLGSTQEREAAIEKLSGEDRLVATMVRGELRKRLGQYAGPLNLS